MKRRNLIILGGAAAATGAGAIRRAPDTTSRHDMTSAQAGLAFEGLAARLANAQRIELRKHDGTLAIQRQGEDWVLPDKGGYRVRPERVRELLVGLTELRLLEPRTSDRGQLDRLGLDDPENPGSTALLLRVLDGNGGAIAELVIGRRRVRTQGNVPESVYVRRPGETQAWLAEGRLPADADSQLWVDRDIANLPKDRVRRVMVNRAGEPPLVLSRTDDAEAKLRMTEPAEHPPLDEVALDEVGRAFEFLTFVDVRPAAEMPGTALGEGSFLLTDDLTITVRPSKEGDTLWIRLEAQGSLESALEAERLNARWRGWAYQVGAWKEKAFVPRIEDLRSREQQAPPQPASPVEAPAEAPAGTPAR